VYSIHTGGRKGSLILCNNHAILLHQGVPCRWAGGNKKWLILAQKARSKTISCKGQRASRPGALPPRLQPLRPWRSSPQLFSLHHAARLSCCLSRCRFFYLAVGVVSSKPRATRRAPGGCVRRASLRGCHTYPDISAMDFSTTHHSWPFQMSGYCPQSCTQRTWVRLPVLSHSHRRVLTVGSKKLSLNAATAPAPTLLLPAYRHRHGRERS